ncbi:unnamed protein product [Cunninghamella echinulata]
MENKKEIAQNIIIGTGLTTLTGTLAAYAISTGINCGAFGATFLVSEVIRESFLSYQQSKNPYYGLKDSETRDIDSLISSTMAGTTTGGLLSAAYRGARGVIPGSVMFGTICAGGQLLYSAFNRWRQDTIINRGYMDLSPDQDIPTKKLWDYIEIPSWSPIRKLSNEEYNQLLDDKLKNLEDEIKQIELELRQNEKKKSQ